MALFLILPLAALILATGAVLTRIGLRGRVVGDDPHCRKCGFNLRGRDETSGPRCPECGADLAAPNATRTGERHRRPAMVIAGLLILLVSAGAVGVGGWKFASTYDFSPWKPTSWLVADLDSADVKVRSDAHNELIRRVNTPGAPQPNVDTIVDAILARQGDRSKKWDPLFGSVVDAAAASGRLDTERTARYIRQGVSATIELKPKLRRRQQLVAHLEVKSDRLGGNNLQLFGHWKTSALTLDDQPMLRAGWASSSGGDEKDEQLAGTSGYGLAVDGSTWDNGKLPHGQHVAKGAVVVRAKLMNFGILGERPAGEPVTAEIPITAPVELVPKDAMVDEFNADPAQRDTMRQAIQSVRVVHGDKDRGEVRLKIVDLPVPISADAFVRQGGAGGAEQKIGSFRTDAHQKPRWQASWNGRKLTFPSGSVVDVILRPSQEPADSTRTLATYWGEEIVLPNVTIDAPYTPPFNHDESLRPAVEKAIGKAELSRNGGKWISVNLHASQSPVKLFYVVALRAPDGREVTLNSAWDVAPKQNYGWSTNVKDFEGAAVPTCDVVFRPDPDWETRSSDLTPPWDGQIVLHNVPITSASQ